MLKQWKSKKTLGIILIAVIIGVLAGCGKITQSPQPQPSLKKQEYVFKEAETPEEIAQRDPIGFDENSPVWKNNKEYNEITIKEYMELGKCKKKTGWFFTDDHPPINAYEKVLIPYILNVWDIIDKQDNERFADVHPEWFSLRKNDPEKFKEFLAQKPKPVSLENKKILHGVDVIAVSDTVIIAHILVTTFYKIPVSRSPIDGKFVYSKPNIETIVLLNAGKAAKYQFFIGMWKEASKTGIYMPPPYTKEKLTLDMEKIKEKAKLRYGVDDLQNYK